VSYITFRRVELCAAFEKSVCCKSTTPSVPVLKKKNKKQKTSDTSVNKTAPDGILFATRVHARR